jgi:hypothetical protein
MRRLVRLNSPKAIATCARRRAGALYIGRRWAKLGSVCLLVLCASVLSARSAVADDGTNPSYAGSTPHITVTQISASEATVTATGTIVPLTLEGQPTLNAFQVQLFDQNETMLPFPCYQDYSDEENTWADNDLAIHDLTQGTVSAGSGGPFTVTLPVPLYSTGPVLFCAYTTDEFVDTVSWSTAQITVTGASTAGGKPANTKLPRVTRSGRQLECTRGSWSGHPTSYRYRWVVLRKAGVAGRQHGLGVTGAMRGHKVECSVTATNSAGGATATSLPFSVT